LRGFSIHIHPFGSYFAAIAPRCEIVISAGLGPAIRTGYFFNNGGTTHYDVFEADLRGKIPVVYIVKKDVF
jgi:hypothetical protein